MGGSDILGGCRGVGDVASVGGFASRGQVGVNWRGVEFRGLGNGTEIAMAQGNGLQHMPERGRSFYLLSLAPRNGTCRAILRAQTHMAKKSGVLIRSRGGGTAALQ